MPSNNADRIKKWREQNRQGGAAILDAAVAQRAMPDAVAVDGSSDTNAALQVDLSSEKPQPANKLDREERLRLDLLDEHRLRYETVHARRLREGPPAKRMTLGFAASGPVSR